jgi:hypothetical protein
MDPIYQISGYETGKEYEWLADAMQSQSVICITDYGKYCRDVAHTLWTPSSDGDGIWQLSGRGITYIYATSREEFIRQCEQYNVEVLMPNTGGCKIEDDCKTPMWCRNKEVCPLARRLPTDTLEG